jgi:hypothetical protein
MRTWETANSCSVREPTVDVRPMVDLPEHERSALTAVANARGAPQALLASWHANQLFEEVESNGLHFRVGHAGSPSLQELSRRYERSSRRPFPSLLASLLSTFNGMNVEETSDGEVTVTREPSVRDVWNGMLAAEDLEADETSDGKFAGLRFAAAYAQARLPLGRWRTRRSDRLRRCQGHARYRRRQPGRFPPRSGENRSVRQSGGWKKNLNRYGMLHPQGIRLSTDS